MKTIKQFTLPINGQVIKLREINCVLPTRKESYDVQIEWQDGYGDDHAIEMDCKDRECATKLFEAIKEYAI